MPLHRDLAEEAIRQHFAEPLEMELFAAAAGIVKIAVDKMASTIRRLTVERGLDPREYSLMAFGGGGPMHAVELARELGMSEAIIPAVPGATSALGLLCVDHKHDFAQAHISSVEHIDPKNVERLFRELEDRARKVLHHEGFRRPEISLNRFMDLRYAGQVRALSISVPVAHSTERWRPSTIATRESTRIGCPKQRWNVRPFELPPSV
jgi:N-methylhydantoinase A